MSLRPPSHYQHNPSGKSPLNILEYELMAERADALGRAGLRAEAALQRLREAAPEEREALTDAGRWKSMRCSSSARCAACATAATSSSAIAFQAR